LKAYDIAGKRAGAGIRQDMFAQRLDWKEPTLRDVEQGKVDITETEHARMNTVLAHMIGEKVEKKEVSV